MPVSVKKIVLWRTEVENEPGALARTIEPLVQAGADLQVVMGYRFPGDESKAAIEVYPVAGRKQAGAAGAVGLQASTIPTLLAEGDDRPGLGHAIAAAVTAAGINFAFFMAQVIGGRYSAVMGFESEEDARKASAVIRKTAAKAA